MAIKQCMLKDDINETVSWKTNVDSYFEKVHGNLVMFMEHRPAIHDR